MFGLLMQAAPLSVAALARAAGSGAAVAPRRCAHGQRHSAARRSGRPPRLHADLRRGRAPPACARQLREGMEAWNVGANVGVYTLQLAHRVGATGRVVAFEPNPEARAVLARNIARNSLQSRVEVVAVGGGVGRPGRSTSTPRAPTAWAAPARPNPRLSATDRIEVPVTTLDRLRVRPRPAARSGRDGHRGLGDCRAAKARARFSARTRLIVELHPDAWQWSGHTRGDLEAAARRGWAGRARR